MSGGYQMFSALVFVLLSTLFPVKLQTFPLVKVKILEKQALCTASVSSLICAGPTRVKNVGTHDAL